MKTGPQSVLSPINLSIQIVRSFFYSKFKETIVHVSPVNNQYLLLQYINPIATIYTVHGWLSWQIYIENAQEILLLQIRIVTWNFWLNFIIKTFQENLLQFPLCLFAVSIVIWMKKYRSKFWIKLFKVIDLWNYTETKIFII